MKSRIAVSAVGIVIILGAGAYLALKNNDSPNQKDTTTATVNKSLAPSFASLPAPTPLNRESGRTDFTALGLEMTPKEAYSIANAILSCSVIQYVSLNIGENEDKNKDQRGIEDDCRRMKNEFPVYDLAKYAAQSGDPQAQLDFPVLAALAFDTEEALLDATLMDDYKKSSLSFLESAGRNGKIEALSKLSESYSSGRFSEADPVLAYAYANAYAQHTGTELARKLATQLSRNLSTSEVIRADDLARKM